MRIKKALIALLLNILMLLTSACSIAEREQAGSKQNEISANEEMIVTQKIVSTDGYIDILFGIAPHRNGIMALGMKNGTLLILIVGEGGVIEETISLEGADGFVNEICSFGTNDEQITILCCAEEGRDNRSFYSVAYDISGTFKEQHEIKGMKDFSLGPCIVSGGLEMYWNPNEILLWNKNLKNSRSIKVTDGSIRTVQMFDGEIYAAVNQESSAGLYRIDPITIELGSPVICGYDAGNSYTTFGGTGEGYINCGDSLYAYNDERNEFNRIMNWYDLELTAEVIRDVIALDDHTFAFTTYEDTDIFTVTVEKTLTKKKTVTVAMLNDPFASPGRYVAYFNKTNEDYHAEIRYYKDIYEFHADLATGDVPDVVGVNGMNVPLTDTIFLDLRPFIEADESINKEGIFESVLESLTVDGALTSLLGSFDLQTLVGRKDILEHVTEWNLEEIKRIGESEERILYLFPMWATSPEMMRWVAHISMGQFVDWKEMRCSFTSDEFIAWLKFCNELPYEVNMNGKLYMDYSDEILLTMQWFQTVTWLEQMKINYEGDAIKFMGFPSDTGSGSYFSRPTHEPVFAVPQLANNREGAVAFVCGLLSEEWQTNVNSIPISRAELNERLDAIRKRSGKLIAEEEINDFVRVIETTDVFSHENESIMEIVLEEASYYFQGDRTAEDAAQIIQNRVSLYLNETE